MKPLKFLQSLVLLAFVAVLTTSCNYDEDPKPGREVTKDYDFIDFDRLEMGDAFNLVVEQGTEYAIHVRGDERDMDDLVVEQDGEKLHFKFDRSGWFNHTRYSTTVTITMPALKAAELSGAVDATISSIIEDDFYLSLSGASTAHLNLTARNVDFDLSGASDLDVIGAAGNMSISLSGASTFKGMEFEVETADVDASGASDVKVNVSTSLKAHASGSSDIIYRGSPVVNSSTSGSSSIRQE